MMRAARASAIALSVVAALTLGGAAAAANATALASAANSDARAAAGTCTVDDAHIVWGFKESFRSYISGSIAHGKWEVADGATYETPSFGWQNGSGTYSSSGVGNLSFAGSIRFTGHGGILDTTVANPALRFDDARTATLLLDVSGTTQDGAEIDQAAVEFLTIDLSAATVTATDGTLTIADAPTALTAAGATAFGTYESGETFDPFTVAFTAEPSCVPVVLLGGTDVSPSAPLTVLDGVIIASLAALIAVLFVAMRRRERGPAA